MKIAMIYPAMVGSLPPLLTASSCMASQDNHVTIFSAGCEDSPLSYLKRFNVDVKHLGFESYPNNLSGKLNLRLKFAKLLFNNLRKLKFDIIWCHTSFAMSYKWIFPSKAIKVAHAHELYSETRLKNIQNSFIENSDVLVVPELNRSWMLRLSAGRMDIRTYVVPNRLPDNAIPQVVADSDDALIAFRMHGGSTYCEKFIIYQGQISEERCILQLISAFSRISDKKIGLIILGSGTDVEYINMVKELCLTSSQIALVPSIPSPGHLRITKCCRWGVLLYAPKDLNTIYCAPNKIFEFAYFGLGMLMPFYPGLQGLLHRFKLGELCNPMDIESIYSALTNLFLIDQSHYINESSRFLKETKKSESLYEEISIHLNKLVRDI